MPRSAWLSARARATQPSKYSMEPPSKDRPNFIRFVDDAGSIVRAIGHPLVVGRDFQHFLARIVVQESLSDCPTFLGTRPIVIGVTEARFTHDTISCSSLLTRRDCGRSDTSAGNFPRIAHGTVPCPRCREQTLHETWRRVAAPCSARRKSRREANSAPGNSARGA